MPWLRTGGTLVLHQPFSPEACLARLGNETCETAVIPGPVLAATQGADLLDHASELRAILSVWRSPEFLATAAAWPKALPACVDVAAFGELAQDLSAPDVVERINRHFGVARPVPAHSEEYAGDIPLATETALKSSDVHSSERMKLP